jgi:hypothetical protein
MPRLDAESWESGQATHTPIPGIATHSPSQGEVEPFSLTAKGPRAKGPSNHAETPPLVTDKNHLVKPTVLARRVLILTQNQALLGDQGRTITGLPLHVCVYKRERECMVLAESSVKFKAVKTQLSRNLRCLRTTFSYL